MHTIRIKMNLTGKAIRNGAMRLDEWVDSKQSRGLYVFTREEALTELKLSPNAFKKAVARLLLKKRVARPSRGFYVIVPVEYVANGILPPEWFIDDLMKYLKKDYYVGVLSAAQYHGAAHQRPTAYHIVASGRGLRKIVCRSLSIRFFWKKNLKNTDIQKIKGPTGQLPVSTPEETAFDLLRYSPGIGGLDRVLTVLQELGEKLDPAALVKTAKKENCMAYAQRLGFLIDKTDFKRKSAMLSEWVAKENPRFVRLHPALPQGGAKRNKKWNIWMNIELEGDLL